MKKINIDIIRQRTNHVLNEKSKIPISIQPRKNLESHDHNYDRKKEIKFLTTRPSKITRINFPEAGSFNAGILDLDNKILKVYTCSAKSVYET